MFEKDLKFYPFTSFVETNFWYLLIKKKINEYKLDNKPINVTGFYCYNLCSQTSSFVILNYKSFNDNLELDVDEIPIYGTIYLFNTIEEFKQFKKQEFLQEQQELIFEKIKNENLSYLDLPKLLNKFYLLTFVDIKKYKCYYWFIFPAFTYPDNSYILEKPTELKKILTQEQLDSLFKLVKKENLRKKSFFLIYLDKDDHIICDSIENYLNIQNNKSEIFVAYFDFSKNTSSPGWVARNLLALLYLKFNKKYITLLSLRKKNNSLSESIVFKIELEQIDTKTEFPGSVGFEKNELNKLQPKIVDLSSTMDPKILVTNAVDLNLKLMRWRLMPDLNLEKISITKCLLLGSGTLGCNVARCLIGWGITNITFVDNSEVSYSNPVRQSLFEFSDCFPIQKQKSIAAAESLKRIYPIINSKGINLSIPMPGHFVDENIWQDTLKDIKTLEKLIDDHDCIYLLMDTRESRWLPTVICHAKKKLVINAALGFDTYLILRHGFTTENNDHKTMSNMIPGQNLGCYYCNDVVAPTNSTKNRTLDQQCTVSRPGISMITAALAVELMVSVLQHPEGKYAPSYISKDEENQYEIDNSILGIIPHQIRGFLSQFSHFLPTCHAYEYCTGCSPKIINEYKNNAEKFLYKVFNENNYLEEISELKKIEEDLDFSDVLALSEDDENYF